MNARICRTCGGPMDAACAGCWAEFEALRDKMISQRTADSLNDDPILRDSPGSAACAVAVVSAGAGFSRMASRATEGPSPFVLACAVEYARLMALEGAA